MTERSIQIMQRRHARTTPLRALGAHAAACIGSLALIALVHPSRAAAQSTESGQATRPIVRSLLGDMAFEIRLAGPGALSIGAADARQSVSLDVRASDARRWADSASRLISLPVRRVRRSAAADTAPPLRYRAVLEEPGLGAGSLVLARVDSGGKKSFVLFAGDADLAGVRQPLEAGEVAMLVRLVRRGVSAATPARPRRAAPQPPGTRKPVPPSSPSPLPPAQKKPVPPPGSRAAPAGKQVTDPVPVPSTRSRARAP